MKRLIILCVFVSGSLFAQEPGYEVPAGDVKTVDGIIQALYDVISGPAGEKRDWNRFKALFTQNAHLCALGKDKAGKIVYRSMTVEDYINGAGQYLEENGFFEVEVSRETDEFGLVTQLFSTYESRNTKEGEIIARGINSIQLAYYADRFWIVNILWNAESEENPIPKQYLK